MIADSIINIIYNIFMFLVGGHEPLRFNINETFYTTVNDFFAFIFYILPVDGLFTILGIIIAITGFRIFISVIKTIWDLLPLL